MKLKSLYWAITAVVSVLLVAAWGIIWHATDQAYDHFEVVSRIVLPNSLALKDAVIVGGRRRRRCG